jgi:hypothetical protein
MSSSKEIKQIGKTDESLEELIDEREFSRITKRSLASVRRDRLLRRGCPYVKLFGLVRYRPSDVRSFIARNLQTVER